MTNEQMIRSLSLRELASLIIRYKYEDDWDYDYDENPYFWGYRTIFVTSDNLEFNEHEYEEALEHECWWLQQEAVALAQNHREDE